MTAPLSCPALAAQPLTPSRDWMRFAVEAIGADRCRSADTHLIRLDFPALRGIDLYFKDESTHPTGSLKHRLARSIFLYGICNGLITEGRPLIEASSGSTAVSEAYFARILGLPFTAVMPRSTSKAKIEAIERLGGCCYFVDHPSELYVAAERLAAETGGYYLDQFTNAERATDWRGADNIADSIFQQMRTERHPVPEWVVMSAGTGGTSATIGRYIRYYNLKTRLCVMDVENSVFYPSYKSGDRSLTSGTGSRIEGIGRPRVEPSFITGVIDHMEQIPDAASIAAAHVLSERLFRPVGGSTGTNFMGMAWLAAGMKAQGQTGSLVSVICDSGERYASTYYNEDWLTSQAIDLLPYKEMLNRFLDTGVYCTP